MADEYYLDHFAQPEGRYHDFSDVSYGELAYMKPAPRPPLAPMRSNIACRSPTREIPRGAFPYPYVDDKRIMRAIPRDSSPLFDTCDKSAAKNHQKKLNAAAPCGKEMLMGGLDGISAAIMPTGSPINVNLFMFMFLMLIFMCIYTVYGVMKIQKELSKLRKLLKLNR